MRTYGGDGEPGHGNAAEPAIADQEIVTAAEIVIKYGFSPTS
jgi:hypothetical protein